MNDTIASEKQTRRRKRRKKEGRKEGKERMESKDGVTMMRLVKRLGWILILVRRLLNIDLFHLD